MTPAERAVLAAALRRHQVLAEVEAGVRGATTALASANRRLRNAVMDLCAERERWGKRAREEVTLVEVIAAMEEA